MNDITVIEKNAYYYVYERALDRLRRELVKKEIEICQLNHKYGRLKEELKKKQRS